MISEDHHERNWSSVASTRILRHNFSNVAQAKKPSIVNYPSSVIMENQEIENCDKNWHQSTELNPFMTFDLENDELAEVYELKMKNDYVEIEHDDDHA